MPAHQLRTLQSVHENFVRALSASLSAYLRTLVSTSILGVEQLSAIDFSRSAARPFTTLALRMRPQESIAFLQLSHAALFPMLEILLGGSGKSPANIDRDITEIERSIFQPPLRILLQDLKAAWRPAAPIEFTAEEEAAARQILASTPAGFELIAIRMELHIGEAAGMLTFGLPSRTIRALLETAPIPFPEPPSNDGPKVRRILERAQVNAQVRLNGPSMLFGDLLNLEPGDVLTFDHPLGKELELELNGTPKFKGHVVAAGNKRGFQIKQNCPDASPADEAQ